MSEGRRLPIEFTTLLAEEEKVHGPNTWRINKGETFPSDLPGLHWPTASPTGFSMALIRY